MDDLDSLRLALAAERHNHQKDNEYFIAELGALREALAVQLEAEVRPLIGERPPKGYNCCGCSTYDLILDHAVSIIRSPHKEKESSAE